MMRRLSVSEAAAEARLHPDTIRKALESASLHGTQRVPRGKWSVREDCLEAFLDGVRCDHQASNVTHIGAARSA